MKICPRCLVEKSVGDYYLNKNGSRRSYCKPCYVEYSRSYYLLKLKNNEQYKQDSRERKRNDDYIAKRKEWYEKNKDIINKKLYNRRRCDIQFKLSAEVRTRLNKAIRNKQKVGSAVRDIGCSMSELKLHLEKQFVEGMSWDNWSHNGWHIDHIKPLNKFDLEKREQLLEAVNYKNLQPLWAKDNIKKSDN